MHSSVYIFDPTLHDAQSKVRGVGRYIQLLKENVPDAIFTDNIKKVPYNAVLIDPFFNVFQFPKSFTKISSKQIAVIHDCIPLQFPVSYPLGIKGKISVCINKFLLSFYDGIITDSRASKKNIVQLLNITEEKISVIYPTLPSIFTDDQQIEIPQENVPSWLPHSQFCIYVGDATWNKNLVTLAHAIKIAKIPTIFVGKVFAEYKDKPEILTHPWQKELKEFLIVARKNPLFIFPGFIPDKHLMYIYKHALCNILVSREEGFGFSYLEAASKMCPSILSSIPVFKEIAKDTACFIDHNNPEAIADCIQKFSLDATFRKELGHKAFERSKHFDRKQFSDAFIALGN